MEMSKRSVLNCLDELGFSSRVTKNCTAGFQLDVEQQVQVALDWLKSIPRDSSCDLQCSIDFTYTSHRTDRRSSFCLKGGSQPHSDVLITSFTYCIVTCVWADGVNRTPAVLYTYNQKFRQDLHSTKLRDAQLDHLVDTLQKFEISSDRVVYMGE